MRPETGLLLWILPLLAGGCASHHPLGSDWQGLSAEARETRALETVRTVLAQRGARIPGRPGSEENQVLLVDRRLAVYRPCSERLGADPWPGGSIAVLLFEDILRLERRVRYDLPSQPEDLSLYLRRNSPSVWAVRTHESLLSPLLSQVGLEGPILLLSYRPQGTYWRLKAALEHLLSLPRPRQGVGPAVEQTLRQAVAEDWDHATFEAEVRTELSSSP